MGREPQRRGRPRTGAWGLGPSCPSLCGVGAREPLTQVVRWHLALTPVVRWHLALTPAEPGTAWSRPSNLASSQSSLAPEALGNGMAP